MATILTEGAEYSVDQYNQGLCDHDIIQMACYRPFKSDGSFFDV